MAIEVGRTAQTDLYCSLLQGDVVLYPIHTRPWSVCVQDNYKWGKGESAIILGEVVLNSSLGSSACCWHIVSLLNDTKKKKWITMQLIHDLKKDNDTDFSETFVTRNAVV